MIFKSEHMTQASGSIAGVTYSRAKGGVLYRRARAIPVNPQTSNQSAIRAALTLLITRWTETLTEVQREAWRNYAEQVPVTNKVGSQINLTGQNWYAACNTPRAQAQDKLQTLIPIVDAAPTMYDRGDFTTPAGLTIDETAGLEFQIQTTDAWANEDDSYLLVFQGLPVNASRKFFKGPFRLLAAVAGNATTPPAATQTTTPGVAASLGFPIVAGTNNCVEFAVSRADGRYSTRRKLGPVVAT